MARMLPQESVSEAVEASLRNAPDIKRRHSASVAALRVLARKIDTQDAYFQALLDDAQEHNGRPPSMDNVSIPTFLKFCDALGLTLTNKAPAKSASVKKPATPPSPMGKFAGLKVV